MMPTVFSATASSRPAFATSSSTNSFILPRLDRPLTGSPCSENHLELRQYEIQATTTFPARFIFIRVASVAAMQERTRNSAQIAAVANANFDFRWTIARKLARKQLQNECLEPSLTVSIVLRDAV